MRDKSVIYADTLHSKYVAAIVLSIATEINIKIYTASHGKQIWKIKFKLIGCNT